MRRSALNHGLRQLLEACAVAALLVLPACNDEDWWDGCGVSWEAPTQHQVETAGTVVSAVHGDGELLLLLREGALVHWSGIGETAELIPATGLRAWAELAGNGRLAVGDGGAVARTQWDWTEWALVDAGTTQDLLDLVADPDGTWALAIARDQLFYTSDAGSTWTELPAPAGGGFRRGFTRGGSDWIWLIGDGGRAWRTSDPTSGDWEAVELGTSADLLDGTEAGFMPRYVAIISAETLFIGMSEQWTAIPVPAGESFLAVGDGYVITERALYQIESSPSSLEKVIELDFTPVAIASSANVVYVAGSGGELVETAEWTCLGRPWVIDGAPRTATLVGEGASDWARDGLYEHASVASFARFVSELLALAAPPALIRAAQAAILDELEHARLCFELATRGHGFLRPGPLPLDRHTTARAGDPIALALAVFEEGCLGESIAAIEAGVAAAETNDPDARRALETIAADECRHAALAWRTLRWLVDEFGAPVREALRHRLAQLDGGGPEVRSRTVAEIIRPLAAALLAVPETDARDRC